RIAGDSVPLEPGTGSHEHQKTAMPRRSGAAPDSAHRSRPPTTPLAIRPIGPPGIRVEDPVLGRHLLVEAAARAADLAYVSEVAPVVRVEPLEALGPEVPPVVGVGGQ